MTEKNVTNGKDTNDNSLRCDPKPKSFSELEQLYKNAPIESKLVEEALEERLRFHELVSRISTKFIGLTGVEFERAIHDALAEIGNFFDVDAVRLYRVISTGRCFENQEPVA